MRTLYALRAWLLLGCLWLAAVGIARPLEEQFIGWKGNTFRPESRDSKMWVQSIAWKPRAFIIHNLINEEEARHIAATAAPTMKRSTVVGPNGSSVLDDYRTSWGTFVNRYETDIIKNVQDRVAQLVRVPVVHQEDMQVLRYAIGQYYHAHQDSLDNDSPRMATLLIYLADAEEGGETAFPTGSVWAHPDLGRIYGSSFSDCAKGHVGIRPRRGDALLFWSIEPDGHTDDPASTHEGCPVIKGAKWTTTIWVHTKPFRPEQFSKATNTFNLPKDSFTDPGFCLNGSGDDVCKGWAARGECKSNPGFMVAECALACKICVACNSSDLPCYNENRRKAGYLVYSTKEFDNRRAASGID